MDGWTVILSVKSLLQGLPCRYYFFSFLPDENVKVEPFDGASGSNEFLYKESKRARLDREKVSDSFISIENEWFNISIIDIMTSLLISIIVYISLLISVIV